MTTPTMPIFDLILKISETKDWHEIDALVQRWQRRTDRWWYIDGRENEAGHGAYRIRHALELARDRSAYLEMRRCADAPRIAAIREQEIRECFAHRSPKAKADQIATDCAAERRRIFTDAMGSD